MNLIHSLRVKLKHVLRMESQRTLFELVVLLGIVIAMFGLSIYSSQFIFVDADDVSTFDHTPTKPEIAGVGRVALVLIGHDRPEDFRQSVSSLFKSRRLDELDIILSMDFPPAFKTLKGLTRSLAAESNYDNLSIKFWKNPTPGYGIRSSDLLITQHHRKIFDRGFLEAKYDYLILLETDLTVSEDIFEYFLKAAPLLQAYPVSKTPPSAVGKRKFFCVSAWNDNGMDYHTLDESRLTRTDYFPGLGWMIHRSAWTDVLRHEWPPGHAYYDDWIRERSSVRSHDCLVPEVSRTHHISRYGVHVRADPWYDQMVLASGKVSIPDSEYALVGDSTLYRDRIISEKISQARIVKWKGHIDIPYAQTIVILFQPIKEVEKINDIFRFFHRGMRNSFAGLMTAQLGDQHGRSNITLIYEPNAAWWGIDPSRIT